MIEMRGVIARAERRIKELTSASVHITQKQCVRFPSFPATLHRDAAPAREYKARYIESICSRMPTTVRTLAAVYVATRIAAVVL